MYDKKIIRDRETNDFAMYLNGELVGYKPTHLQAEIELNSLVHHLLTRTAHAATSDVPAEDVPAAAAAMVAAPAPAAPAPAPVSTVQPIWVSTSVEALQVALVILDQRWQRAVLDGDWVKADEIEL